MQIRFTLREAVIVLALVGGILMLAIPALREQRLRAQGETCNGQLEQIFNAKEQIAFKMSVRVGRDSIIVAPADIDIYLRGFSMAKGDALCPSGGRYNWNHLYNQGSQSVMVPQCSWRTQTGGKGWQQTWEEQGLHVHRPSYTPNTYGIYTKNETAEFCQ